MLTGDDLLVEAPVAIRWKGRPARALFAVLALHPGEPVSRDRLAGLLWAENDQQAARGSLRMALLSLRRAIDPVDPDLISATNESITLDLERGAVDVALFESLCAEGDVDSRVKALELYRGDLRATFPAPHEAVAELLHERCERVRQLAVETGMDLISAFEEAAMRDRVRWVARKLLAIEPANEPAHRAMMRAHARAGDRSAALRQYEQCCAAIRGEYDLDPAAETVALRDEIIAAETAEAAGQETPSGGSQVGEAAARERPPSRRVRRRWLWLSLAALALVAVGTAVRTVQPCGLLWTCADDTPLAVIVLKPLEFVEPDPQVAEIADDITAIVAQTLGRIPDATVMTATAPGELPVFPEGSYVVEARVVRIDNKLRVYVRLHDRRTGAVIWADQIPFGTETLAPIASGLEAGLIPELRSRIELDRSPD